ncbi:MAG: hypothetical protein JNJ60_09450, partial [Rhodocyclaceae bacterium]|nr:hypothetical protein [Rhodocyclaceae bacterium]
TGNTVEASIKNGSVVTANHASNGAVNVSATDVSGIFATLVSASVAAGGAGAASVNVAGALVYASNAMSSGLDFDWNGDGTIDFHDLHAGVAVLTRLNELRAGADGIFDDMPTPGADGFVDTDSTPSFDDGSTADDNLTADQAIDALGGLSVFAAGQPSAAYKAALKAKIGSTFDINGDGNIDYRDLRLTGTTSDDVQVGNALKASIDNSTVDTAGEVTVSAQTVDGADQMEIESFGIAVGIAAGGAGGVSVNVAGAGVIAFNQINNAVEASIVGSTVDADDGVSVAAEDKAHILSELGAVSVSAGGAGGLSVNVAVSATYAENTLGGSLLATIADSTVSSSGGNVTVEAFAHNALEAYAQSVGVSVGGAGGVSINLAVSAVLANNSLSNDVEASIVNGSDVDGDAISLNATDSSSMDSVLTAVSVSIGGAGAVSLNLSLALSIAEVDFGTSTQAIISGSEVTAASGNVTLDALSDGTVNSEGVAVGVSFGAAGGVSGSAAAAGAIASLTSSNLVEALIAGGSDVDAGLGSVLLTATDQTAFTNDVVGVSVGGSFAGGSSIALSVAFAEADSTMGGTVRARISDSDVDAGVNVELTALADSTLTSNGTGVAISMSAAIGFSLAGAGAGAVVNNNITQNVQADILASNTNDGQDVSAGGAVLLTATDSIWSKADATAASISISGGFVAGGIAISAAQASNTLAGTTSAAIDDSRVRANTGALSVSANSESELFATPDAYAVAVAIGIGAAGAGAGASGTNTVTRTTRAQVRNNSDARAIGAAGVGLMTVEAHDTLDATADVNAVSFAGSPGGALAAGIALSSNTINSQTKASVENSTVESRGGDLKIVADSTQLEADLVTSADASAVGIGLISGAIVGARAVETVNSTVEAYASNSTLLARNYLKVDADSHHDVTPHVTGFAASLGVSISAAEAIGKVLGATRAYVDGASTITIGNDADITADSIATATPSGGTIAVGLASGVGLAEFKAEV